MKEKKPTDPKIVTLKTPEKRFPKAAVDYINTLLDVQRDRFERELAAYIPAVPHAPLPALPKAAHILAEADEFMGSGWSDLGRRRDGTAFRWMGRIGTLLLQVDTSEPLPFVLFGCGFTKKRFLTECTLWLEDMPVAFTLTRQGLNRWTMTGELPAIPKRPYTILRLQSPGIARLAVGINANFSLAVSELRINCPLRSPGSAAAKPVLD